MIAYGKGLPKEVESQRSLTRRELGISTFCKIVAARRHPSLSRVYIEENLHLKYSVSTPEKISICLIRGRNESLGNDDVSIVHSRKYMYEVVRMTSNRKYPKGPLRRVDFVALMVRSYFEFFVTLFSDIPRSSCSESYGSSDSREGNMKSQGAYNCVNTWRVCQTRVLSFTNLLLETICKTQISLRE